jgi:uncharacterized repeat protein (TIGR01451 family)
MLTKLLATTAVAVAVLVPASTAFAAGTSTGADLQVSGSSNLGSPVQGQPYTYTFQVKNSGPQDALSATFTDDLTAGKLVYAQVQAPTFATNCSQTSDGAGGTSISCPISLAKGQQVNVVESVNAPSTIGSFANTGTVTAADVADPQPANNSSTVNVKVGSAACPLPAGQQTVTGLITGRQNDSFGIVNKLTMNGNDGVKYTVFVNFDGDPTAPPTTAINLLCKVVPPNLYIQPFTTDNVTGTVDMEVLPGDTVATPVIHATVVQTPFWTDKVA